MAWLASPAVHLEIAPWKPHGLHPVPAARGAATDMSTRALIFAALLCGLAVLVAFTVQVVITR